MTQTLRDIMQTALRHRLPSVIKSATVCLRCQSRATAAAHTTLSRSHNAAAVSHLQLLPQQSFHTTQLPAAHSDQPDPEPSPDFEVLGSSTDEAVRELGELFGSARMDIEDAVESIGTTYFSDDAEVAIQSAGNVLRQYEYALELAGKDGKQDGLRQSWSLKLEQLKGEVEKMKHDGNLE